VKAEVRVVAARVAETVEVETAVAKGVAVMAVDLVEAGTGAVTGAAEKEVAMAVEATVEAMGAEETAVIAERLRSAIADRPIDLGQAKLPVTVSIGSALSSSHMEAESLIA
jgi:GGDEF domain-containing protein